MLRIGEADSTPSVSVRASAGEVVAHGLDARSVSKSETEKAIIRTCGSWSTAC